MKLSNSAVDKYILCPKKYELHYHEKIRSTKIASPLFFGKAIDEALNELLKTKIKGKKQEQDEQMIFLDHMIRTTHNDVLVELSKNVDVYYYKSDLDIDLLSDIDKTLLKEYKKEVGADSLSDLSEKKVWTKEDLSYYNYSCWLSLVAKGKMLIQTYKDEILPEISEVIEIQKEIDVGDGKDSLVGFVDFIGKFVGDDKTYIIDNKTSSSKYKDDSVVNSQQLAIYAEHCGLENAAYIVLDKKIRKKDPRVRWQIVKGVITEDHLDIVFDKITEVFHNIEAESFEPNWDSCWAFGKKCEYYDYCRNKSMRSLIKK